MRRKRERKTNARGVVLLWIFLALVAAGTLRTFVVAPFLVVSRSMAPTLVVGDLLLVDKLAYRTKLPAPGDVIVWKSSERRRNNAPDFVKRVIALPGDVVAQKEGRLFVNQAELTLEFVENVVLDDDGVALPHQRFLARYENWSESLGGGSHAVLKRKLALPASDVSWTVPPGHLFVTGDNRDDSLDSRADSFEQVAVEDVVGRVRWVVMSRSQQGWKKKRFFLRVH